MSHAIALLAREIDRDMAMLGACYTRDICREMLCSTQATWATEVSTIMVLTPLSWSSWIISMMRPRVGADRPLLHHLLDRCVHLRAPLDFGRIAHIIERLKSLWSKAPKLRCLLGLGLATDDHVLLHEHWHVVWILASCTCGVTFMRVRHSIAPARGFALAGLLWLLLLLGLGAMDPLSRVVCTVHARTSADPAEQK